MVLLSYDPITGTTDGRHFPPLRGIQPPSDRRRGLGTGDGWGGEGKPPLLRHPSPTAEGAKTKRKNEGRLNLERLLTIFVYVPGGSLGKKIKLINK